MGIDERAWKGRDVVLRFPQPIAPRARRGGLGVRPRLVHAAGVLEGRVLEGRVRRGRAGIRRRAHQNCGAPSTRDAAGFTLLELVIVVAIFSMVLTAAYQILITTLQADERITKATRSGKIGEAVLGIIRRDLQGAVWRGLGTQVFRGIDNGEGESAEDELHFITTARVPPPPEELAEEWMGDLASVGYVLRPEGDGRGILFRRVRWVWQDDPLEEGDYFPVYERAVSLSFTYLDREAEWVENWESSERIQGENLTLLPEDTGPTTTEESEDSQEIDEEEPPLAIPRAVRIELRIQLSSEGGVVVDDAGEPVVELYSAVVPLIASEELLLEEDLLGGDGDEPSDQGGAGDGSAGSGAGSGTAGR